MTLTVEDLNATLANENHLGWGYACCSDIGATKKARLDRAVVAVANELEMTADELFAWSNSKHGRWLSDLINGWGESPSRATVRKQMSREIVDFLVAEEKQYA